jgi:hypothetical protein
MPNGGRTIPLTSILPAVVLIVKDPARHPVAATLRSLGSFCLSGIMSGCS